MRKILDIGDHATISELIADEPTRSNQSKRPVHEFSSVVGVVDQTTEVRHPIRERMF